MARNITNIQKVASKAKRNTVEPVQWGGYRVVSSTSGKAYHVTLAPVPSCTCEWAKYQPQDQPVACSHVQAAVQHKAQQAGYSAVARSTSDDVSALKRKQEKLGNGVQFTYRKRAAAPAHDGSIIGAGITDDDINDALFG